MKWSLRSDASTGGDFELEREIEHAAHVAGRVMSHLVSRRPSSFPQKKKPWYAGDDEDQPK
jgi:hypothetical protein